MFYRTERINSEPQRVTEFSCSKNWAEATKGLNTIKVAEGVIYVNWNMVNRDGDRIVEVYSEFPIDLNKVNLGAEKLSTSYRRKY